MVGNASDTPDRDLAGRVEERIRQVIPSPGAVSSVTPIPLPPTDATEIWVAPDGKTGNDGTAAAPVPSLAAARDRLRQQRRNGLSGVV